MTKKTYIDIFAGCGGVSLGLYNSGKWKGLFAVEKSPMAFKTLEYNLIDRNNHFEWPEWLDKKAHDINDVIANHEGDLLACRGTVDLVVGGPPCQGFSVAGKRKEDDGRNTLIDSYLKFVELVQPKVIFFENVKGFTIGFKGADGTRGEPYSKYVIRKLQELGYHDAEAKIVNFSDYGVPQRRERCIIVGSLAGIGDDFRSQIESTKASFLKEKGIGARTTLSDAISDLLRKHGEIPSPDTKGFMAGKYGKRGITAYQTLLRGKYSKKNVPDSHRFVNHRPHIKEKYAYVIKNQLSAKEIREEYPTNKTTTILLKKDKVSATLTTLPDDFIHFAEPRILTVREYARIQSFNDWYQFQAKYTTGGPNRTKEVPRYSQLGNAVPPLFVEHCGNVLYDLILEPELV